MTLHQRLNELAATMPALETCNLADPRVGVWLGKAHLAVIHVDRQLGDEFKTAADWLAIGGARLRSAMAIRRVLTMAVDLGAPPQTEGPSDALIATGDKFGLFLQLTEILQTAKQDVWFVDPWMEDRALIDYGPGLPAGVNLRLFTSKRKQSDKLIAAAGPWRATKDKAPLAVRLIESAALHDRFVAIDGKAVWLLSQSLNGFANTAPGTVVLLSADITDAKLQAYRALWDRADVV